MSFLSSIKNKTTQFTSAIGIFTRDFLYKTLGKERTQSAKKWVISVKNEINRRLYSHLDENGKYYPLIRKIYKFSYWVLFLSIGFYLQLVTNFLWLTGKMPGIDDLQNPKMNQASTIISSDGEVIGKFFTENRTAVDSSQISKWMFDALISTEDKRFEDHSGIDLTRMASVAYGVVTGKKELGGGSTISQQLAKNLYNIRKKEMHGLLSYIPKLNTLINKSKEWITAIQLEKRYTKGEIATMYLNTVDYGNNAFGINTAARVYFNKPPDKLDPSESAVLVGLQKATTYYNPIRNPENSKKRRNVVLSRMVEGNYLAKEEAEVMMAKDIKLDLNYQETSDDYGSYYKIAMANQIKKWADDNDMDIDIYRDGLKIYTTLDSRMQGYAEAALETHMRMLQKEFNAQWRDQNPWRYENGEEITNYIDQVMKRTTYYKYLDSKYEGNVDSINHYMNKPVPMKLFSWDGPIKQEISPIDSIKYYKRFLQSGMMAFDPYTGFIKAWVGGVDFSHFKYDHVRQAKRQPGSAFKPIVYSAAIDGPLNLSPCDRREDKQIQYGKGPTAWTPKNAGGHYSGANLTLRSALARSVNTVAVQLTNEVTPKAVATYAKKMGINSKFEEDLTIGLGTSDVSLYDLVASYGIFLNEGLYREPILVYKIADKSGKIIAEFTPKEHVAIRPESAYLMQFMLRGNVEEPGGTGRRMFNYGSLFRNGGQVAGKTGTTSNNSDGWYVGFTKDMVAGVWVGGDDRSIHFKSGLGEGSKAALPIFGIFMDKVYSDKNLGYSAGPFPKPTIKIEKDYLNCYSYGGGEAETDSLQMELDSIRAFKDRFHNDSSINMNKIDRKPSLIKRDSLN